ncbi:MAG: NUDIX domain-containing protein [Clostridia bacterium]|nr:NUDIX domain-containing protein [Clostridia bacterium]
MSTELIDVLDENGVKTGEILSRDEIHKRGLWHRAIVVAIINGNNEVLLQQRSEKKEKNAGMWDISVAGHISTGQDALSAAAREINEEVSVDLGYKVDIKSFRYMFSYRTQQKYSKDFIENQFYDFFILRKDEISIENIKMQESEVQAIKFVGINKLTQMIEENKIVDRKPVYEELINYLHRY